MAGPQTSQPGQPQTRMSYHGPFEHLHEKSDRRVLIVADHASNALPVDYGDLGLPESSFGRHIACDLGIAALARSLSDSLSAPAILAGFSRLLIDPNRGEDDPTLVMRLSDGEIIAGNAKADAAEIARRIDQFHRPYHNEIDNALDVAIESGISPLLVSVHSFTPTWRGWLRPWHCGVLWAGDPPTAGFSLTFLRAMKDIVVGDNQPYSGELEGDCMDRHGTRRGIAHVLIEIRQDLLATPDGRADWTARLAGLVRALLERTRAGS